LIDSSLHLCQGTELNEEDKRKLGHRISLESTTMKGFVRRIILLLLTTFYAQSWPVPSRSYNSFIHRKSASFGFKLTSTDENESSKMLSKSLIEQAQRAKLEAERMEAELTLSKISKLEKSLRVKGDLSTSELRNIHSELLNLVRVVDPSIHVPDVKSLDNKERSIKSSLADISDDRKIYNHLKRNTNRTLSEEDMENAVSFFLSLPRHVQLTLASIVQLDLDRVDPAVIVLSLYELGDDIPIETISSTYKTILDTEVNTDTIFKMTKRNTALTAGKSDNADPIFNVSDLLGKDPEQYKIDSIVESLLPRVTRNKGKEPTKEDIDLFVRLACGKDTFMLGGSPEKIPGGYLLRGNNQHKSGTELVQALDAKIGSSAPEWNQKFQASFIVDPTRTNVESNSVDGDPVLIITSSDFAPTTNRILLSIISSASLFLTFLFSIAAFGSTDAVMKRVMEANQLGNYDTAWFNYLLLPLVGSIGLIQIMHESGHFFFAWKDKFKFYPPTILPILSLPYLSFQNKLKTSPPDYSSLFNFAYSGPALGMITSAAFLIIGLKLTLAMDPTAIQYSPSLPVGILRLSSLGEEFYTFS